MEEMTALEMQRFLNQQYADGKTELEAYRNLMDILGLTYPCRTTKNKAEEIIYILENNIPEVPAEEGELEAFEEGRKDSEENGTISHNDINWD